MCPAAGLSMAAVAAAAAAVASDSAAAASSPVAPSSFPSNSVGGGISDAAANMDPCLELGLGRGERERRDCGATSVSDDVIVVLVSALAAVTTATAAARETSGATLVEAAEVSDPVGTIF